MNMNMFFEITKVRAPLFRDEDINNLVWEPFLSAVIQMAISFLLNAVFAELAYKSTPIVFNNVACLFGFCQMFLTSSMHLICFTYVTIALYTIFFYISIKLTELFNCSHLSILKLYLILYASCCFRIYSVQHNLDEFLIILITLSIKLLCAAKNESGQSSNTPPDKLTLIAYLTYAPWISFTAFMTLRRKRHRKTPEWFLRLFLAIPQAFIFKLLSHNIITIDYFYEMSINSIVFSMIKGFQYRNKYYFRGQIAEIELLAVGAKQHNWMKHLMFDFQNVEFSVAIKSAVKGLNRPLADFFHDSFLVRDNDNRRVTALVHIVFFHVAISFYSVRYAALFMIFLGSIYFQEKALSTLQEFFDICLYSCPTPFCYHRFGPRYVNFYYLKTVFIFSNHFRMSVLFVNSETIFSSITCILVFMGIDILITICFHETFKKKFHYFKYLKNRQ